jgi:hypothetical protein
MGPHPPAKAASVTTEGRRERGIAPSLTLILALYRGETFTITIMIMFHIVFSCKYSVVCGSRVST